MVKLSTLRAAPLAFARWLGVVGSEAPSARIVLFHGTPRASAASLEGQLRWIKRRFQIVPLRSLIAAAANGDAALGRKAALTFDDGLRSNVEVAYPILRRLAIPATFFICPGLIDRGAWLWNHEARRRCAHLAPHARRELAAEWRAPHEVEDFVEWMKTLAPDARRRVEARLREATPRFSPSAREREECDLAGWEELRRLDPAVVAVGSHTLTHAILPVAPPAEVETEVRDSRRVLERGLERPVDLFAYPNGDHNDAVEACVRKHYRAAMTAARGWVSRGADAHRLPRLAAPPGVLRLARRLYP